MKALLFPFCAGLLVMVSCAGWFERKESNGGKSDAQVVADSVSPMLPPPFGLLLGGLATALTGVAAVGANKASNKAFKAKAKPSLLVSLATDHSWLMPALGALAAAARASGVLHFSDTELAMLMTTLTAPVGVKKVMRKQEVPSA